MSEAFLVFLDCLQFGEKKIINQAFACYCLMGEKSLSQQYKIKINALDVILDVFDTFQSSVVFHIETSHLISCANQVTNFLYEMQHWTVIG